MFAHSICPQQEPVTNYIIQERLKPFLRMVREWRHMKMLKRRGRGHSTDDIEDTAKGELSVRCPACPRVGVNMPSNWDTISDDMKYVRGLMVSYTLLTVRQIYLHHVHCHGR